MASDCVAVTNWKGFGARGRWRTTGDVIGCCALLRTVRCAAIALLMLPALACSEEGNSGGRPVDGGGGRGAGGSIDASEAGGADAATSGAGGSVDASGAGQADATTSGAGVLARAKPFSGSPRMPVAVTYIDVSGVTQTVLASPGRLLLIVEPNSVDATTVTALAEANGASVIAAIPVAGEYWLGVKDGQEATFVSSIASRPGVLLAVPDVPVAVADGVVDLIHATSLAPLSVAGQNIAQFDDFRNPDHCGTHGDEVQAFLSEGAQSVSGYGIGREATDSVFGLARVASGAAQGGSRLIVNMSLQSLGEPNDQQDRSGCEGDPVLRVCSSGTCAGGLPCTGDYRSWKRSEFAFLSQIAALIEHMDSAVRDNTLVVLSAGNAGLDLTTELMDLRSTYPNAVVNMLIVGSRDAPVFKAHNHTSGSSDMLYADGFGLEVPGQPGCVVDGTSFAAPQVANLVAQLSKQFPKLTAAALARAVLNAATPDSNDRLAIPSLSEAVLAAARIGRDAGTPTDAGRDATDASD